MSPPTRKQCMNDCISILENNLKSSKSTSAWLLKKKLYLVWVILSFLSSHVFIFQNWGKILHWSNFEKILIFNIIPYQFINGTATVNNECKYFKHDLCKSPMRGLDKTSKHMSSRCLSLDLKNLKRFFKIKWFAFLTHNYGYRYT